MNQCFNRPCRFKTIILGLLWDEYQLWNRETFLLFEGKTLFNKLWLSFDKMTKLDLRLKKYIINLLVEK